MSGARISLLLPDMGFGGAERVNLNLANAFAERGLHVDVVLMKAAGDFLPLLDPRVRVVDLGRARARHLLLPLTRYLRERQPDALLANMWPLTGISILARTLARSRTRVVAVEHTSWSGDAHPRASGLTVAMMRVLLPRADAALAVSAGAADDLMRFAGLPAGSVGVIHNPIVAKLGTDPAEALPDPWEGGPQKRILAVGELKSEKDLPTLLRAFAILRRSVDARLILLGDGALRSSLEALVGALGLGPHVRMPGFDPCPARYYAHADLFVLSSHQEGFGNVIVEALEQGTPVVSTDCRSGPREILMDGEFGRLVPIRDPDALAEAMKASLSARHDPGRLKARAQDFSIDAIADQYLRILLPGWTRAAATGGPGVGRLGEASVAPLGNETR